MSEQDNDKAVELATETLAGDIRDFLLNEAKEHHSPVPWPERTEAQQIAAVDRANRLARRVVKDAIGLVAAEGLPNLIGKLVSINVKGAAKATVEIDRNEQHFLALCGASGKEVRVVLTAADDFDGQRAEATIRPDQGDIERYAEEAASNADFAENGPAPAADPEAQSLAELERNAPAGPDDGPAGYGGDDGNGGEADPGDPERGAASDDAPVGEGMGQATSADADWPGEMPPESYTGGAAEELSPEARAELMAEGAREVPAGETIAQAAERVQREEEQAAADMAAAEPEVVPQAERAEPQAGNGDSPFPGDGSVATTTPMPTESTPAAGGGRKRTRNRAS